MKKILLTVTALLAISGCATQTETAERMEANPAHYLQNGSQLLSIDHFEVEQSTVVALMNYLDNQDRLCFQWVSSAKKTLDKSTSESSVTTTISVHCGGYEIRKTSNPLLGTSGNEYVPTDLKAINEFKNSDRLTVQSLEI
ncbi:hypothetical protein TUMSATVNIG1_60420 (plasmid) [Vibrio nigripulchritudo]|uniref:hypothetical protein n=1 Tax=Vibrio nigripulchritudo TaxID=28173 RepID=UPI00190A0474|nr:hypothetical protein [Vibrio nigripulchritudo]BCL74056.1 hypothetical protein VNTUMSATTG_59930 [Vibrio nigripulchritudo]BDU35433.1 hypothetical protein TUMSATVNIG1_60420 [Vibrio nigripulchritudo]